MFWLIGATDGHAKNFSIFLNPGGRFRMTPLYDVLSAQPSLDNGQVQRKNFKLAMSIGKSRHYGVEEVMPRHFVQSAAMAGIGASLVRSTFEDIVANTMMKAEQAIDDLPPDFPEQLVASISEAMTHRITMIEEKPQPGCIMTAGLLVSAARSGAGKTTVTLGLLAALARRGMVLRAAKAGPDYIDPAFHAVATGAPCINLDSWTMPPSLLQALMAGTTEAADLLVVEGVMGLFDGVPGVADRDGSSASIAARFKSTGAAGARRDRAIAIRRRYGARLCQSSS